MGNTKQKTSSSSEQTTTPTASPMEDQFNKTMGDYLNKLMPQAGDTSSAFLDLLRQGATAFGGGAAAQGPLGQLLAGISPDAQNSMVQESLRQITPQFQQGGILNSGSAASIASRTAGDIYRNSAEFNVNNLGGVLSALLTGNAQTQQPINQQAGILSGNLQGLRSINQTGSSTSTTSRNPFLEGLYGGAGAAIGGGLNPTNFAMGGTKQLTASGAINATPTYNPFWGK